MYNKKNNQDKIGHWGDIIKTKMNIIEKFAGKKVLDVGCSTGDYVIYLNNHGYDAYGCDISKNKLWMRKPSKFKIGNIYKLPYRKNSFDTVIALEIFEHLDNPELALKEIRRVANKNIILSVPNCELPSVFYHAGLSFYHHIDKTHINRFIEKDIKELLVKNNYKVDFFKLLSPIRPAILFLYTSHFPLFLATFIGKVISKMPTSKKIYSDMLIVASINKNL